MFELMSAGAIVADEVTPSLPSDTLITWATSNGESLNQVLATIAGLTPALLPVAVGCIAFRKGIGFLFSILRGA